MSITNHQASDHPHLIHTTPRTVHQNSHNVRVLLISVDGFGDLPAGGLLLGQPGRAIPKTPLALHPLPNIQRLRRSAFGLVDPVAPGLACGSDTAHLSLLGSDPNKVYRGRGALEGIGGGIPMPPGSIAFKSCLGEFDLQSAAGQAYLYSSKTQIDPYNTNSTLPICVNRKLKEKERDCIRLCAELDTLELSSSGHVWIQQQWYDVSHDDATTFAKYQELCQKYNVKHHAGIDTMSNDIPTVAGQPHTIMTPPSLPSIVHQYAKLPDVIKKQFPNAQAYSKLQQQQHPPCKSCRNPHTVFGYCFCELTLRVYHAGGHRCVVLLTHKLGLSDCVTDTDPCKAPLHLRISLPVDTSPAALFTSLVLNRVSRGSAIMLDRGRIVLLRGAGMSIHLGSKSNITAVACTHIVAGVCMTLGSNVFNMPEPNCDVQYKLKAVATLLGLHQKAPVASAPHIPHAQQQQQQYHHHQQQLIEEASQNTTTTTTTTSPQQISESTTSSLDPQNIPIVFYHVKGTDDCSHEGDFEVKGNAMKNVDDSLGVLFKLYEHEWLQWEDAVTEWITQQITHCRQAKSNDETQIISPSSQHSLPSTHHIPSPRFSFKRDIDGHNNFIERCEHCLLRDDGFINNASPFTRICSCTMPTPPKPIVTCLLGDHSTPCSYAEHSTEPVPIMIHTMTRDGETASCVTVEEVLPHDVSIGLSHSRAVEMTSNDLIQRVSPTLSEGGSTGGTLGRMRGGDVVNVITEIGIRREEEWNTMFQQLRQWACNIILANSL